MLRKILLIILLVILLIAAGVYIYMRSKVRVDPHAPIFTEFTGFSERQLSTITFPVSISLDDVQDKLNEKLESKPIHVQMPIDDSSGTLELDLEFYDHISLTWEDQQIVAVVPLHISAMAETTRLGIHMRNKKPVEAKVEVILIVEPELVAGWELKCDAQLKKITWLQTPVLDLGPVKIDLSERTAARIQDHQEDIEKVVEKQVNRALRIHDVIEKVWKDIQKPIRVNKKGIPLWLKMEGQNLSAKWETVSTDNPTMIVSIDGYYELTAGKETQPEIYAYTPLPPFHPASITETGIKAYVNAKLPYSELCDFVSPRLDTLKLEYADYKVKIRRFEIFGGDSLLYFKMTLRGDIRGSIYIQGTPRFSEDGRSVRVDNFNYDLYTESELASTADDWLHDMLLAEANSKLSFELDSLLEKLPEAMMRGIENSKVGNKIDVEVNTLTLKPLAVRSATDHLALQIYAEGNVALKLEKEILKKKKKKSLSYPSRGYDKTN